MSNEYLEALCAAYDELSLGVVILSLSGRILFANAPARSMIDTRWPIRASDGHVQASEPEAHAEIGRFLESLKGRRAHAGEYEFCLARFSAGQGGAIGCFRLLNSSSGGDPALAFFITESQQSSHYGLNGFSQAYKLSKAETRTLKEFVETQSPARTGARLDIALSTVKSHIRKIFNKTGTSRQAELLRLVEGCRTPFRKAE
jgi:DNA-binding CsgD family transcriptional regulator